MKEFLNRITALLCSTYFKFNDTFYKQSVGSTMGGPSSPMFAEIALEELENMCLKTLKTSILFYRRYVDDWFLVVKKSDVDFVFNTLNNQNNLLQFTLEIESRNKLNSLDTTLIIV